MAPAPRVAGRQRRQWLGPALALALGLGLAAAAAAAAVEVTGHLEVNPPDFVRDLEDALPAGHALDEDHQHICQLADGGGRVDCYPRVFQPTDEFQLVRPGQLLPHGLHVKVDMATGERYGKRLSANEPGDAADALDLVVAPVETGKPAPGASAEEDGSGGVAPLTPERKAELDALWEQLMALARQETEQLLAALQTLRDPEATSAALLGALHTMEDIVHQIDYGRDLVAMEGLEPIVRLLDHADAAVRAQVATVLGSALQSNPDLQQAVRERFGLVERLMAHVRAEAEPANIKRLLFTLGALVRGHAANARDFVHNAGVQLLETLFYHERATPDIRRRCVTLVADLATDGQLHGADVLGHIDPEQWCGPLGTLLREPHVASIEKALDATDVLQPQCPALQPSIAAALAHLDSERAAARAGGEPTDHVDEVRARVALLQLSQPAS